MYPSECRSTNRHGPGGNVAYHPSVGRTGCRATFASGSYPAPAMPGSPMSGTRVSFSRKGVRIGVGVDHNRVAVDAVRPLGQ